MVGGVGRRGRFCVGGVDDTKNVIGHSMIPKLSSDDRTAEDEEDGGLPPGPCSVATCLLG